MVAAVMVISTNLVGKLLLKKMMKLKEATGVMEWAAGLKHSRRLAVTSSAAAGFGTT